MTNEPEWIKQLNAVRFARANSHWFEIRLIPNVGRDWRSKSGFIAKMKANGSRGKIMANATGKTENEAIENLLKSEYWGTDKTVADIMGINAEQSNNQN